MSQSTDEDVIICRTSRWYHKRRVIMILLLLGFSGSFFYDWKIGYPKKKALWEQYMPAYLEAKEKNQIEEYVKLAAEKGWNEKPDDEAGKDWDYKIKEQLVSGIITAAVGLTWLGFYLRNSRRTLQADRESITTTHGERVPFHAFYRLDKRKWDHKGLAYAWWRDESGAEQRAVIDDFIWNGAGNVLKRLEENFKGELIQLSKEDASPEAAPPSAEEATAGEAEQKEEPPAGDNKAATA